MISQTDYIIAGGGAAGCVLANRLSEDPSRKVVLLEAGGEADNWKFRMPAGSVFLMNNPETDWMYKTEPDPSLNGRVSTWNAGRALGGGSSVNGMVYIRGDRSDYDSWADSGCTGWSWSDVFPYFLKSERFFGEPMQSHGRHGPMGVSPNANDYRQAEAFVEACVESGLARIDDYCDGLVDGVFPNYFTQRKGVRTSTALTFLKEARQRPNLEVLTGATVDKVFMDDGRAAGIEFIRKGQRQRIRANAEVIVSAGTLQSPAILMRSGIGPASQLAQHGIEVVADSPQVGQNLQEHASFPICFFTTVPTLNAQMRPYRLPFELLKYLIMGKGLMTASPVQAIGYLRSRPGLERPDLKISFGPMVFDAGRRKAHKRSGVSIFTNVAAPKSRGEIRLRSADASDAPVIAHNLIGHPDDVTALVSGLQQVVEILHAPSYRDYLAEPCIPAKLPEKDSEWEAALRTYCNIGYHVVGTCRMGSDREAVVDPRLRVSGVEALRVIDASIMPVMPYANTNAPAIMVGEKGADMVREDARRA